MRLATIIRCYALTDFLRPCIKQYDWVERVLVLNYRFPKAMIYEDNTEQIVNDLGQKNAELIKGEGLEMHQVIMEGLNLLRGYDAVFLSDADEFILRSDQEKMARELDYTIGVANIIDYTKGLTHILPRRGHKPAIIVKPGASFYGHRNFWNERRYFDNIDVHHFGYALTDEHMAWKQEWHNKEEPGVMSGIVCQSHTPYTLPEEIKNLIGDN